MKKMTFNVGSPNEETFTLLIREVNKISNRIKLNLNDGIVIVEDVSDTDISKVIDLINSYYTISNFEFDNVDEETSELVKFDSEESDQFVEKKEPNNETKMIPMTQYQIKNNIQFQNEYIEQLISKLLKTVDWAMNCKGLSEKTIGKFIITTMTEISMNYSVQKCVEFAVGNIVDCCYGLHLYGEITGGNVPSIVCNISPNGMVYLVPILFMQSAPVGNSYLSFSKQSHTFDNSKAYIGNIVLLNKGKYVNPKRIRSVMGKVTPKFFDKLLKQLSTTFDFTENSVNVKTDISDITSSCIEEASDDTANNSSEADDYVEYSYSENSVEKESMEEALLKILGESLNQLDTTKTAKAQIDTFLSNIGFPNDNQIVVQAFIISCNINKISYTSVIHELCNLYPEQKNTTIKKILQENFKHWLKNHPELEQNYPKISIISLLKLFAKKFA